MTMTPEQMRKKSLARDEAHRHKIYGAVDRTKARDEPQQSAAVDREENRVRAATRKEEATIGKPDPRPNDERY